ncbi:MAG: hypothetical protein MJE68_13330 [Proteobacteria bacterium]|nr:hypothetical protein [Pseudomonadota bacterium]
MEVCGGESVKDWEGLGKSLSIPDAKLEEISLTHKDDVEKSKEQLFKVWMNVIILIDCLR